MSGCAPRCPRTVHSRRPVPAAACGGRVRRGRLRLRTGCPKRTYTPRLAAAHAGRHPRKLPIRRVRGALPTSCESTTPRARTPPAPRVLGRQPPYGHTAQRPRRQWWCLLGVDHPLPRVDPGEGGANRRGEVLRSLDTTRCEGAESAQGDFPGIAPQDDEVAARDGHGPGLERRSAQQRPFPVASTCSARAATPGAPTANQRARSGRPERPSPITGMPPRGAEDAGRGRPGRGPPPRESRRSVDLRRPAWNCLGQRGERGTCGRPEVGTAGRRVSNGAAAPGQPDARSAAPDAAAGRRGADPCPCNPSNRPAWPTLNGSYGQLTPP